MALHIQLPVILWVMKIATYKVSRATKASLRQNRANLGPVAYFICRIRRLPLTSVPYVTMLEEITPFPQTHYLENPLGLTE
jgi:hypothetical protein